MRVKPYIVRARRDLQTVSGEIETQLYSNLKSVGVRFLAEGAVMHDTGPRFRGREPWEMAKRGAHFVLEGERLPSGRTGL